MHQISRPHISLSILTYNRSAILKESLFALTQLTYAPLEILVIDNSSTDTTPSMVLTHFPSITYLRTSQNIGTAARNLGLRSAKGEIVITLDDDVTGLRDSDLYFIAGLFAHRPTLGAVTFRIINYYTGALCNWVHHCRSDKYHNTEFPTYEIAEGAAAFRKRAVEAAGYYPEYFFLSHEGPALAYSILDSGFQVIYSPAVVVTHQAAPEGRTPWRNYYYDTRNQFWLAARSLPFAYASLYLMRGLSSMLFYSIRDGFGKYWLKGVRDGLKGLRKPLAERKVLSDRTMRIIRKIDAARPPLTYLIYTRISRKDINLSHSS